MKHLELSMGLIAAITGQGVIYWWHNQYNWASDIVCNRLTPPDHTRTRSRLWYIAFMHSNHKVRRKCE